jgi:hypothetical protein
MGTRTHLGMTFPAIVNDPRQLPLNSHAVSFHVTWEEAAEHAASFLAGTPVGQPARFWAHAGSAVPVYADAVDLLAPQLRDSLYALTEEQVAASDGKLRPIPEIQRFFAAHPAGISAGGNTLSLYWNAENLPQHLEYERWVNEQPREASRLLCPYDLRRVPPERASEAMRALGASHSHVVLSDTDDREAQVLQLFLFESIEHLPRSLEEGYRAAVREGLVGIEPLRRSLDLTPEGVRAVREWSRRAGMPVRSGAPRPDPGLLEGCPGVHRALVRRAAVGC